MSGSRPTKDADTRLREEIKVLCLELRSPNPSVTKRRETGKRLLDILSKERNRNRIVEIFVEQSMRKGFSQAKARKQAHQFAWGPIIKSAFYSASVLTSRQAKRHKLDPDDVKLPLKILHFSDMATEGSRVKVECTTKLNSKEVHEVLEFCFNMLENDEVRAIAETELMNTMVYLCERVDYVANFNPNDEVLKILSTAEAVLSVDEGDNSTAAARAFGSILESCVELGMGLFVVVNKSVRLVARWCSAHMEEADKNPRELAHLFRGVTAILRFHPEQSIKPLIRCGRILLQFAKRSYLKATTPNKHAIHGYLIAHIIVNQKAGELRGGVSGELGDIGKATLTSEQVDHILPMVLASLAKIDLAMTVKKRVVWSSLEGTIRRHLECCARLLACAQRHFLVEEEWKLLDDPNDFFIKMAREFSRNREAVVHRPSYSSYPSCPASVLAGSPWVEHVLNPLLLVKPEVNSVSHFGTPSTIDSFSQRTSQEIGVDSNPPMRHPLLDCIHQSTMKVDMDTNNLSLLLLVISACAEAFPSGRCWGSASHNHWFTLRPEDGKVGSLVHIHGSSAIDLALVVHAVANVLEVSGGSSGDPELQLLSLLCLIRLTEAHRTLVFLARDYDMKELASSWRQVWTLLFRADLRYAVSTGRALEGTCGELVLVLLTEIVHGWCTDPSMLHSQSVSQKQSTFLYRRQCQIWALPAFSKGSSLRTKQIFELTSALLHRICLSDEGRDNIRDEAPLLEAETSAEDKSQRSMGRRQRLVFLCLDTLYAPTILKDKDMAMVVSACLTALVNGKVSTRSRTFVDETRNLTWIRPEVIDDLKNKFCFTELTGLPIGKVKPLSFEQRSYLFHTLWASPILDPGASSLQLIRLHEAKFSDCVLAEKFTLCSRIHSFDESSVHVDYVSMAVSTSLRDMLVFQLTGLKDQWTSSLGGDEETGQTGKSRPGTGLSMRCLLLKISLAVFALVDDDQISAGLEELQEKTLSTFDSVSTSVPALCGDRQNFHSIFLDLLQIFRFLTEMTSILPVGISPTMKGGIASFAETCDSLLLSFAGEENQQSCDDNSSDDDNQSMDSSDNEGRYQQKKKIVDLLEDSDEDEIVNKRNTVTKKKSPKKSKKRKSGSSKRRGDAPRKKRKKQQPSPPDGCCAGLVGSILMTLEPSISRCESVIECLLKTGKKDSDVDLTQAYQCANFLCHSSLFFHENALSQLGISKSNPMDESYLQQSPISLVVSVLDSLRKSASPASSLHMFGFGLYKDCAHLGENDLRGVKLSMDEAKQIADHLFVGEHQSLDLRPFLRSDRLRAATAAFQVNSSTLEPAMKEKFKGLSQSSLKDLCPFVRSFACQAVGVALRTVSNKDDIMNYVSNRLPPVFLQENTKSKKKTYQEWYQNLGTDDVDDSVWNDALMSMERSAIQCRSVFAGVSPGCTLDIVYALIKMSSSRSDLEALCFHACDQIALKLGYENAEACLEDMGESILGKWLDDGESLESIPLLLTSPRLLRLLLKTGQQQSLDYNGDEDIEGDPGKVKVLNGTNLEGCAVDDFVVRHRAYLVPQMLLGICSSNETEESQSAIARVASDKHFQEFCFTLKGNHDDETIKEIVQSRLHDIEAFCAPMKARSELDSLGRGLMKFVQDVLYQDSEPEADQGRKSHLTVRRILELSGKSSSEIYPKSLIQEAFSEAIVGFVDTLKPTKSGDILAAAGTSLTECFLYTRQWLESATLASQKQMRWEALDLLLNLVLNEIHQKEFNQTQLMFGTNVLVDVLLNSGLACIHGKALNVLKRIIEAVVEGAEKTPALREQFSFASKRLISSLMKIHEDSQLDLLRVSNRNGMHKTEILMRAAGLLGKQDGSSDTWGWGDSSVAMTRSPIRLETALHEYRRSDADANVVIEALKGTYNLLVTIFENSAALGLKQESFVGCMPPYSVSPTQQEALAAEDARFCAQVTALDFIKRSQVNDSEEDLSQFMESVLSELKNRSSWMDSLSGDPEAANEHDNPSTLSMSHWMLRAALAQLEHKLRQRRTSFEDPLLDKGSMLLVRELSYVCGASCPEQLRAAASRCLGELNPNLSHKKSSDKPKENDRIQSALAADNLLRGIQAQAIEVLGEYLHSNVAISAVETLIALLATRDGSNCWNFLDPKKRERLLPVLSGKRRAVNIHKMSLTELCVASIKAKAGLPVDTHPEWCWEAGLWHCPEGSYDSWICDLVPAILSCCYRDITSLQSSSAYFYVCQTMASIAPRFATAIFKALVLDLLEKPGNAAADSPHSHSGSNFKHVAEDTWIGAAGSNINSHFSSCFEVLLGNPKNCDAPPQDKQAISLALDTLEILRRATQFRFEKSESHKRNSNAMPSSSRSSKKAGRSSRTGRSPKSPSESVDVADEKMEYNIGFGESIPWKGVPFGTVLQLSGELVVKACIRVRRYASALFYADLYFESSFSGSGAIMERLSTDFAGASLRACSYSKTDISGYFTDSKACERSTLRDRAIGSLKLLGECYMELCEVDAYQAVERQSLDLRHSDCDMLALDTGDVGHVLDPSLGELQRLDSLATIRRNPVSTSLRTADTIESLGLNSILQSYIGSMEWSKVSVMSEVQKRRLREKWCESRLYGMNWDKALLDNPLTESGPQSSRKHIVLGEAELAREEMGFHEAITDALSAYAHDDMRSCKGLLHIARESLFEPISALATVESSWQGMPMLIERLQFLNDIENLVEGAESIDNLLERWGCSARRNRGQAPTRPVSEASYASAYFSPHVREVMLRILRFNSSRQHSVIEAFDPQQCLVEHLWLFSRWCRQMRFLPQAESSLQRLRSALEFKSESAMKVPLSLELVLGQRLEEAHLRESRGDFATAIRLSKQAIGLLREEKKRRSDPSIDCILVDALINCGGWLSKNKIEPARVILQEYFVSGAVGAKALLKQSNTPENKQRYLKAQIALARLSSSLFDSISARVKSTEWAKAGQSLKERQQELNHCNAMLLEIKEKQKKGNKKQVAQLLNEHTELLYYGRQLKNEVKLALDERNKTVKACKDHLSLAVKSFASALAIAGVGQDTDMSRHVFRMVHLWLSNSTEGKGNFNSEVNAIVDESIDKIPSFRFVTLTNQLFAHIDSKYHSKFQTALHRLVGKMCRDHPYHCLVQLISVCNGKDVGEGVGGRSAEFFLENMSESKIDAAAEISQALRRKEPKWVGELLENYQVLMSAYIKLANAPTAKYVESGQIKKIPLSQASNSQRLDRCLHRTQDCLPCVLTCPPPLRSGCDYGSGFEDPVGGERVKGFEGTFSITDSGLHRPKIVMCEGSNGGRFRQLVKGEDEIRQDAVMEQVFTHVNDLMRRQDADSTVAAQSRNGSNDLHMVTYNIVPLSPASGVLEWVENSMTFGDYILDTKSSSKGYNLGAHSRFYPGEWGHSRCRQHYNMSPKEEKRETFDTVCKFCSPSFRFFFVERFGHSLKDWYTAKMKYTRSVAVSSIVGHILGIGDRHTNNILVSQITGEVVHIDFGIVFEQGKLLAVPEVVPFRLTRNIVDGMGPTGTEGVFARSAEATLKTIRENADALKTILGAIASDPLYRWSVSPVEARRRQRLTDDENQPALKKDRIKNGEQASLTESKDRNEAAALVLAKIQEKLQGYEDGTSGEQQGIEGQVQLLINSARDPANLSSMFAGWAPWV